MSEKVDADEWLAVRKEQGKQIDPRTAEVMWKYAQVLDPYGVKDLPEECDCVGRQYFARSPGSEIWVWFGDLPEETANALWEAHNEEPHRPIRAGSHTPKLFRVSSVAHVDGYQDVPVEFFVNRELGYKPVWLGRPWTAFIADGRRAPCGYTQSAVGELFTEDEAKMLVEYLKKIAPDSLPTVTPFSLPVRGPMIALTEEDRGVVFPLYERDDYSLPFRVAGFSWLMDGVFIRKDEAGRFVVYKNGAPISTPFADHCAAAAWRDHLLPH